MKLYADQPVRRFRQVVGDLAVLAWVIAWVAIGRGVHQVIGALAAPGRTLESAGTSLAGGLSNIGDSLAGVPLIGDGMRAPFDAAGGAAGSITTAGVELQTGVARVALVAALSVAGWPILMAVLTWWTRRLRFARKAGAATRLLTSGTDLDLFALRALTRLPLPTLAAISPDPAGDWRRGDLAVVRALAALELRSVGVRLPAEP